VQQIESTSTLQWESSKKLITPRVASSLLDVLWIQRGSRTNANESVNTPELLHAPLPRLPPEFLSDRA
jgi:hypothetical protein